MTGPDPYRPRLADAHVADLLAEFPAVMINGARATGKTTTARQHASEVLALDVPGVAAAMRADPDAALRRAGRPLLLDEWQEVPEVLAAVKRSVDRNSSPGQFLLTGSVRADLTHEMWAGTGRIVRMVMSGLTEYELRGEVRATRSPFLTRLAEAGDASVRGESVEEHLRLPPDVPDIDGYIALALRGAFPELAYRDRTPRGREAWLSSYLDDLLTRDAAVVEQRKDPVRLRRYFEVLSLNLAGMPTDASLHEAAAVNTKTAAGYDRLLESLYVVDQVPAWTNSRLTSLVRATKRYVVEPALAATATRLTAGTVLRDGDLLGRFFDAFGLAQLRPEAALMYPKPRLSHLRTHGGRQEVDLVVELAAGRVLGIEFKVGASPDARDARHLHWFADEIGSDFAAGAVIHSGSHVYQLGERVWAVPMCALWA
jgi:predicted AAA+ superfamily ATPase